MKARYWCRRHKRWHSKHAKLHCVVGGCARTNCPVKKGPR